MRWLATNHKRKKWNTPEDLMKLTKKRNMERRNMEDGEWNKRGVEKRMPEMATSGTNLLHLFPFQLKCTF